MAEIHYGEDGAIGYKEGDILINYITGERSLVVRDARGLSLVPERKPAGRPPRAHAAGRPLALRVPDDQRATWEDCAQRAGIDLAEWIREACDLAVARGSTR